MKITRKMSLSRKLVTVGLWLTCCTTLSSLWAQQPIRISAGGASSTFVSQAGEQWLTDRYFTGGDTLYTSDAIANTHDRYLYGTARYGLYGDFEYKIPVANGSYNLTLKFAEIYYWNKGNRVFNVTVNGQQVLTNFDIVAEVGSRAALDKSFPVTVTNGVLNIQFKGVIHYGIVSAILIEPSATQPVTISVNPAQVSLGSGQTAQFAATVGGTTDTRVTWTASEGAISATGPLHGAGRHHPGAYRHRDRNQHGRFLPHGHRDGQSEDAGHREPEPELGQRGERRDAATDRAGERHFGHPRHMVSHQGRDHRHGLFTAPAVAAATPVTITAQSVADTSATGVAQITVNPPTSTGRPHSSRPTARW